MSPWTIGGIAIGGVLGILLLGLLATVFVLGRRFAACLRRHPTFTWDGEGQETAQVFSYAESTDPLLTDLRDAFDLEAIAGSGPDLERWERLMVWVHRLTTHAPNPKQPDRMDGLFLAQSALNGQQRFNCWMYATVLNDVLLSLGYPSRIVHLYPIQEKPGESHFITLAFSRERSKWVQLDPDMCTIVTDESGTPLDPGEIRDSIASGKPLRVSNTIHMAYAGWLGKRLLKRLYLWYLTKNLFRFESPIQSAPGYETALSGRDYLQLIPDGYHDEWLREPCVTARGNTITYTRDRARFWQAPTL